MKLTLILFSLLTVFSTWGVISGFEWDTLPDAIIYACAGGQVTFPWLFRTEDEDVIADIHWVFSGVLSEDLIAATAHDHFLAADRYTDRVRQMGNSGLVLGGLVTADSGNYSVEVSVQNQGSLVTHRHSVHLQVGDTFIEQGGSLKAAQDPVAVWNELNKQWNIRLKCGTFTFLGEPDLHVVWTTPTGESKSSSGYDAGNFFLSLDTPVLGGNYTCTIPKQLLSEVCYSPDKDMSVTASVTVNEVSSRLSLLEAEQKTLMNDNKRLEEQHHRDIKLLTDTIAEMNVSHNELTEAFEALQKSMREKVEAMWNDTQKKESYVHAQCEEGHYTAIDDPKRSPEYPDNNDDMCDKNLRPGWYRFYLGGQNAVMPTECVTPHKCGTDAPIWLDLQDQKLPDVGQQVSGRACAHWSDDCCKWESPITVLNCGQFYIYKIKPRSECHLAFCAEVQ